MARHDGVREATVAEIDGVQGGAGNGLKEAGRQLIGS